MFCSFAITKIQSNYYRTNFFPLFPTFLFLSSRVTNFFRNFAVQPDEETGSAEEQPASNMAVPTLKAVDERAALPMDGSLHSEGPVR